MKNIFLTALLIIFSYTINAQSKWSFGVEVFPNLVTKNLVFGENFEDEPFKKSLNGVVKTYYQLSGKSTLSIGLGYSNLGYIQTHYLDEEGKPYYDREHVEFCGTGLYENYHNNTFSSHHNIQIPLQYRYTIFNSLYVNAGVSGIINFRNSITSREDRSKKTIEDNKYFRTLNMSLQFGIGYNFYKNEKMQLYIQPTIERYGLNILNDRYSYKGPTAVGVVLGARIF